MLFDTRVSIAFTPGCSHRLHPGVKQGDMGVLATITKHSDEKSLYIGEQNEFALRSMNRRKAIFLLIDKLYPSIEIIKQKMFR